VSGSPRAGAARWWCGSTTRQQRQLPLNLPQRIHRTRLVPFINMALGLRPTSDGGSGIGGQAAFGWRRGH